MTDIAASDLPLVLIVDDDPQLRGVASIILGSPTRQLAVAADVDEGFAVVRSRPVRVVVADYQMPGKSGLDFYVQLRAEGYTMPFILMSGDSHARAAVAERGAGMHAVLTKPVSPMQLRRIVEEALQGEASA
jgi:DNA-binding NtrC family response regulator